MMSRCSTILVLVVLAYLLMSASAAMAQTQTLFPTDDNNVLLSKPTTVQPNTTTFALKVASPSQSNARIGFLKFDLSGIPSIADPVTFTATTGTDATANFTLQLYGLDAGAANFNWTEDAITYNTRPAPSTTGVLVDTTLATAVGGNVSIPSGTTAGATASFTFTGMENFRQSDNTATLIFLISAQDSSTPSLSFNSSEATSGQPTLTVPVPEPATIGMLAMGMCGMLVRRRRTR